MKNCQDTPNQNIKIIKELYIKNSFLFKSSGIFLKKLLEAPNIVFIQFLKKKVGPRRYKKIIKNTDKNGNISKKKLKNKNSAIKNIDPGNPKKIKEFNKIVRNNFGHKKLIPLISVISLDLNLLFIASTNKNELVDNKAWLINMQKVDKINGVCPLITQKVNQCISTTVE